MGASSNESRYAYMASGLLKEHGHPIILVGLKKGEEVFGEKILYIQDKPIVKDIDTVTMYVGPKHQKDYYSYIEALKPKRVIFNPGTENKEFEDLLDKKGIEIEEACTLVLLRTNQY